MADAGIATARAKTNGQSAKQPRKEPEAPIIQMTRLSDVEPREVEWLWPQKFPLGMLSVISGDPDVGKSTILLDMAARISKARPWPDSRDTPNKVGNTILILAEDSHSQVRVRIDNAHGDPARIQILDGMRLPYDGYVEPMSIDKDAYILSRILDQDKLIRMVGIDPLDAFMGERTDSHRKADVVRVLTGLAMIAEHHNVAVVGVLHLRKSSADKAIYRTLGSLGFVSAPRAVWAVSRDKDDRSKRLMTSVKCNIAREPTGLSFTIEDAGLIYWGSEPVVMTADQALEAQRPESKSSRADAADWLLELLAVGPMQSDAIKALAKKDGISWRTLSDAKGDLGVKSSNRVDGWYWSIQERKDGVV